MEEFHGIYLITAPTFLGYSFNPVSFWYLYDRHQSLKAMILEVNNTFDERRMYFIRDTSSLMSPALHLDERKNPDFRGDWVKDFHVSPFNSTLGRYALKSDDPLASSRSQAVRFSNHITLTTSKDQRKLDASVRSLHSIDPSMLSFWEAISFLLSWWWVGFVTFPRIVKEAGLLFFFRKLHVWYRPEVQRHSIGRQASQDEMFVNARPSICDPADAELVLLPWYSGI